MNSTAVAVSPAWTPRLLEGYSRRGRLRPPLQDFTPPPAQRIVWHNGGTWGFRALAAYALDRGTAAVVMSNTARSVDRLGLRLVEPTREPRRGATRQ